MVDQEHRCSPHTDDRVAIRRRNMIFVLNCANLQRLRPFLHNGHHLGRSRVRTIDS